MQMSELQAKSNNNLALCPFCGGEAEMLTAESMNGGYLFGIMCNDCRSRGDVYDTEAEAIAAWNTRHVETCENMREKFGYKRLFVCSECGVSFDPDCEINYCPSCGRKVMRNERVHHRLRVDSA